MFGVTIMSHFCHFATMTTYNVTSNNVTRLSLVTMTTYNVVATPIRHHAYLEGA